MPEAAASIEKSIPAIVALIAPNGWDSAASLPTFDEAVAAGQKLLDFRRALLAAAEEDGLPVSDDVAVFAEHLLMIAGLMVERVNDVLHALLERGAASIQ